jgi:hypothetical protein
MLHRIDMVAVYIRDWSAAVVWCGEQLGFTKLYVEDAHHRLEGNDLNLHV